MSTYGKQENVVKMKVYTYFNMQRKRADGSIPIYLCVARPPQRLYIHTGLFSSVVFDDGIFPRTERNHKAKTIRLNEIIEGTEKVVLENSTVGHHELKALIAERVLGKVSGNNLIDMLKKYAAKCNAIRTRQLYEATARKIEIYDRTATLSLTNLWLEKFLDHERSIGNDDNSTAIHLRNIRSVFNWAIKNRWTDNYPFEYFNIPSKKTRKRSLSLEDMRYIIHADVKPSQMKFRDLFVLMFYLIGVNGVDLLNATKDQLVNGRFTYRRSKTHKEYSVKVYPEAMELIERLSGRNHLLCFADTSSYLHTMGKLNKALKDIMSGLSSYYARHTWAQMAYDIDIPFDTISDALGHEHGSKITSVYVDFNQKKVDEANRKVIDYVLGIGEFSGSPT